MPIQKEIYEFISTGVPDVLLRVLKGARPVFPDELVESFRQLAARYAKVKIAIDKKTEEKNGLRKAIINFAESIPGLRGIRSAPDRFSVMVVSRRKIVWNRESLRASLGNYYNFVAREELTATVTLPPQMDEKKVRRKIMELLEEVGISKKDASKFIKIDVELQIDKQKLDELCRTKRIELLPEAKSISIEWAVEVDQF